MSGLDQFTWPKYRYSFDDYAKEVGLTHAQKMNLKKSISAGRSQSKIPEILQVGRAVRDEQQKQYDQHANIQNLEQEVAELKAELEKTRSEYDQHANIQKLEQEIAELKAELEKTRSEYDQYHSSIMDAPPRGPCVDKFDYDARGISERNQDIINKFKDLFIGHYIYIHL